MSHTGKMCLAASVTAAARSVRTAAGTMRIPVWSQVSSPPGSAHCCPFYFDFFSSCDCNRKWVIVMFMQIHRSHVTFPREGNVTKKSQNHGIVIRLEWTTGGHLVKPPCLSKVLEHTPEVCVPVAFKCLQERRFHNLSGQPFQRSITLTVQVTVAEPSCLCNQVAREL